MKCIDRLIFIVIASLGALVLFTTPTSAQTTNYEATLAQGSSLDPRKAGGVRLNFTDLGNPATLTLELNALKIEAPDGSIVRIVEPPAKSTGKPGDFVTLPPGNNCTALSRKGFDAQDAPKTRNNISRPAWHIQAKATYNAPDNNSKSIADGDWDFGIIQNLTNLAYVVTYGTADDRGLTVNYSLLDQALKEHDPALDASKPFYSSQSVVKFEHGSISALISDRPLMKACEKRDNAELTGATLKGTFDVYYVLRNRKTKQMIFFWHTQYKADRVWKRDALDNWSGSGSLVRTEDGPGLGKSRRTPVVSGPTVGNLLSKPDVFARLVELDRVN